MREIFENILKPQDRKVFFSLCEDPQPILKDSFEPVKNLLFIFRRNYDYTMKLISLIEESNLKSSSVDSLIELFCHQFYDNILIPNPEQEELQILCYLILKREIDRMSCASVFTFCEEDHTFAGKFLKSFAMKQELKTYLSNTLGALIQEIEYVEDECLDLNPKCLQDYVEKSAMRRKEKEKERERECIKEEMIHDIGEFLTRNVSKCKLVFDREKDRKEDDNRNNKSEMYMQSLSQDGINEMLMQEENDVNLREFYLKQLERINKDADIFTNNKFIKSLNDFSDKEKIAGLYKKNFLYIKTKIEDTLQQLINKISTLPYILRCICKMIHILISKKFPKINAYEKNSFLGEFIFGKWILPMLLNSNANAIILSVGLEQKTRTCLNIISKVITQVNRGLLFESGIDTDFTIFNPFIIEVLPQIHLFYNKLIDVQFPHVLDKLVQSDATEPTLSSYRIEVLKRNLMRKANQTQQKDPDAQTTDQYKETVLYEYFDNNADESESMQCICFSIQDINTIITLLYKNINEFASYPQFPFFKKTVEKIKNDDYKLSQEAKESVKRIQQRRKEKNKDPPDSENDYEFREFFLVYKEEQNPNIQKKETERYMKLADNKDNIDIHKRIKFCIKTILRGLNMINKKDYSYLNNAKSTKDFFSALKYTLDDLEANIEIEEGSKIPLKWYSQYIKNNESHLPKEYQQNDYALLYDELSQEENDTLKFLKEYIGTIFTMNGMNIRCAEKINEKVKRDLFRVQQIERYFKIEEFVRTSEIEVCIQEISKEDQKQKSNAGLFSIFSKGGEYKDKSQKSDDPQIEIVDAIDCMHKRLYYLGNITDNQKKRDFIKTHPKNIAQFIEKMKNCKYVIDGIRTGDQKYKIYEIFEKYLKIVKNEMDKKSNIFGEDLEQEKLLILEKIEKYIMRKMHLKVFPYHPSDRDFSFTKKTQELKDIKPEDLEIKKISVNELTFAIECIKKIDQGNSVYDKLESIASAYNTINNTLKFSSGKDCDGGAEDLSPIFQYIIIQAEPKYFYSNINYIKALLSPSKYKGMFGFLLSQIEFSAEFIRNLKKGEIGKEKEKGTSGVS